MASLNPLMDFKQNRRFQNLIEIISDSLPDNEQLQEKLTSLATTKASFIKKILLEWEERTTSDYDKLDIRALNIAYLSNQTHERFDVEDRDGTFQTITPKEWVLKSKTQWRRFDIMFGGDIKFDENFLPLVIVDKPTGSINLIVKIRNFIRRGSEMCLGDEIWISPIKPEVFAADFSFFVKTFQE
jgi:hypothetical protein